MGDKVGTRHRRDQTKKKGKMKSWGESYMHIACFVIQTPNVKIQL